MFFTLAFQPLRVIKANVDYITFNVNIINELISLLMFVLDV